MSEGTAALEPGSIASLVNLTGPIDCAEGGDAGPRAEPDFGAAPGGAAAAASWRFWRRDRRTPSRIA